MTAKEKAKSLVDRMERSKEMPYQYAKQCALIAVNEIIDSIDWHPLEYPNKEIIFWNEVIEEINKL